MSLVLLVLGAAIAAAGIAMIGFGIPINEFSLGNTLIIAGTVAFVGGLVVVGLGAAVRQLRRIADLPNARPLTRMPRSAEPLESLTSAALTRPAAPPPQMPFPPRPRNEGPRDMRVPEPRLFATEFVDDSGPGQPRPPFPLSPRNGQEPQMVAEAEDVPLSPMTAPRSPLPARPVDLRPLRPLTESLRKTAPEMPRPPLIVRPADRPSPAASFDKVWPADLRPAHEPQEAPARGTARAEPAPQTRPAGSNGDATHSEPIHPAEPRPVSILKSGVVDGMAYTLYTDGSIEAELAEGVVRFGSIEELRNHLEKSA